MSDLNITTDKQKPNYWKIFGIIVIVLLIIAGLYFGYNYASSSAYQKGINYGIEYIAGQQTQTGNIAYYTNSSGNWTITSTPITKLCERYSNVKA